jgi:hypothetical protein
MVLTFEKSYLIIGSSEKYKTNFYICNFKTLLIVGSLSSFGIAKKRFLFGVIA